MPADSASGTRVAGRLGPAVRGAGRCGSSRVGGDRRSWSSSTRWSKPAVRTGQKPARARIERLTRKDPRAAAAAGSRSLLAGSSGRTWGGSGGWRSAVRRHNCGLAPLARLAGNAANQRDERVGEMGKEIVAWNHRSPLAAGRLRAADKEREGAEQDWGGRAGGRGKEGTTRNAGAQDSSFGGIGRTQWMIQLTDKY